MSQSSIAFDLPVWNGIKESPHSKIATLRINETQIEGLFKQKAKRLIRYEDNYVHMTPLKGSKYVDNLRKGKIDWILSYGSYFENILEIGGGDSSNREYIQHKTYTIVDPALEQCENSESLRLINEYVERVDFDISYDAILMLSVLEHVDSAETVTEKVATILRSDGCIFVVIPIVDRQFAIGDFNALVHEHMYYFTLGGAVRLFENYGLEIASYHMRNDAGYFKLKRSMGGIRNNAIRYEFPLEHARMSFDIQLEKFFNILKSDERILFYGATNGLNNLFHLSRQQIDIDYEKFRVTDSDPSKWDKYLSSHPLPILPSDRTADYKTICISALSFYDEIINRLDQDKVIISIGSL